MHEEGNKKEGTDFCGELRKEDLLLVDHDSDWRVAKAIGNSKFNEEHGGRNVSVNIEFLDGEELQNLSAKA